MEILNVLQRKLRFKRYAESTIECYVGYSEMFLKDIGCRDPYQVSIKQIVHYLENRSYTSASQQTQIISSLKVFAKYILNRKVDNINIERPKMPKKVQPVIPREKMLEVLPKISNLKHRAIISLGYGCGLRVSEVINLKWSDIDRKQRIVNIRDSKGAKDRIVPISQTLIDLLIRYYREHKPKQYVFSGQDWRPQYSAGSCNQIVKVNFGEQYRFHSLRKSCGVHLYDMGNDMSKIQDLFGHSSEKTTRQYVGVTPASIKQLSDLL